MSNNEDTNLNVETKTVEQETTQKTYTVEDVNNSFKAGLKKAKTELESSEDYKKYQDWVKSNQNDSEKIKSLETSNSQKDSEISDLKAELVLSKANVKEGFEKFVKSEIISMVNDTVSFDDALKSYKKDNPQFFGDTVVTKVQSSPTLAGGTKPQTTNDIMNNLLRGNK